MLETIDTKTKKALYIYNLKKSSIDIPLNISSLVPIITLPTQKCYGMD